VFSNADSLNLGPDITSCPDEQVILQANPGFKSYTWEDGSTTMTHIVNLPGIYYVDVEDSCGRINRDSITVGWYNPQFFTAGPDKIKCNADTLQLSATPGLTGYQWSPPYAILTPQSSTIAVNPLIDTTYYVTAIDNNGCNVYDTVKITVNESPPINLGPDIGFCAGDSALLDAGPSFISYSWNNGSSSQSIVIYTKALYNVVATATNGCSSADSIDVSVYSKPSNFLPAEAFLCNKDSIQLSPFGNYQAYLWNTGATSGLISIVQPGLYWLQVIDNNGCIAKEFVEVKEKKCVQGIYVPSAFTPDNNGRNDRFKPLVYERLKQYSFSIYNRWGSLVFTTRDISNGWDGKIAGVLQDANVYVWICSYQIEGKPMVEAKGTFVLIR
jgi:gliding motility-associated-like protein